jgi:hypothetical protein
MKAGTASWINGGVGSSAHRAEGLFEQLASGASPQPNGHDEFGNAKQRLTR